MNNKFFMTNNINLYFLVKSCKQHLNLLCYVNNYLLEYNPPKYLSNNVQKQTIKFIIKGYSQDK